MNDFKNVTEIIAAAILFVGVMAFVVSVITEGLKHWTWFREAIPTPLAVIVLSLVLCPLTLAAAAQYLDIVIEWYMVFAAFIAAWIVALTCMDGWERVTDILNRMVGKRPGGGDA